VVFSAVLLLSAFLFRPAFAQIDPSQNTEIQLLTKQKALQEECAQIAKAVPCAVGIGDVDQLSAAINRSERDARYKLAQSIKAFVSYAASDSSWIENGVAQELSKANGKISIDSIALANSSVLNAEYGIITDGISGKRFYRVVTLMVLNPQLYAEAQKETAESASILAEPETKKNDFKNIANKTASVLLGIARRAIGL
jgi:hypothetical protein